MNATRRGRRPARVIPCTVCGLDPVRYPDHAQLHVREAEIDPERTALVEAQNLALRNALGLPPTVPPPSGERP